MLHSGIDLHKRDLVIHTVNADGQVVREQRVPATRAAVGRYFAGMTGPHRAVVESTASWYWLADYLASAGIDVRLGHSKYIKAISYAKVKTDRVDASTLAQLLRTDLLPEGHMMSAGHREARDLLRARLKLVVQHVRAHHVIEGLLTQYNVTSVSALPPLVQVRTTVLSEQRTLLAQQIKRIEHTLQPELIPTRDVQRLVWIPGIGKIVAFTLILEIDDIRRFPSARDFVSYCRLVPGAGNSGGKTRHKRTKDGNRYLKLAFAHAAVRAIQYCPEVRSFYQTVARRKPKAIARALVAKELARIVYFVLRNQEPFNGTFKGKPLSRPKQLQWPRLASPPV